MKRLLPLLAVSLLLPMPALASHLGDDWEGVLRGLYEAPDGSLVMLTATWTYYADWPMPADPARLRSLDVRVVPIEGGAARTLAHPTISTAVVPDEIPRFQLTLAADGLAWATTWSWRAYNACGPTTIQKPRLMFLQASNTVDRYAALGGEPAVMLADLVEAEMLEHMDAAQGAGDQVRGDLADSGFTTLDGAWLTPVGFFGNPEGDLVNGEAGARKLDPGPDGWWNCNYGNLPI